MLRARLHGHCVQLSYCAVWLHDEVLLWMLLLMGCGIVGRDEELASCSSVSVCRVLQRLEDDRLVMHAMLALEVVCQWNVGAKVSHGAHCSTAGLLVESRLAIGSRSSQLIVVFADHCAIATVHAFLIDLP